MIIGRNTALGVDITDKRISLALLKKSQKGLELVRTADGPVPEGALKDGNVVNPAALAKAIKLLKTKVGAGSVNTAMSLFAKPVLLQIMDMPKVLPTNVRQFVLNEVRQCVVLPAKNIAFDYCGIDTTKKIAETRLFVAGTEGQNLSNVALACNKSVLNVEVIEPVLLACTRAIYDKRIAARFGCNVLVALLSNDVMSLCVFRNQALDFIRTKPIGQENAEPAKFCQWLGREISEIIQFYDVDVTDSAGKWEITVVADTMELPEDTQEALKAEVPCVDMKVITRRNALINTVVGGHSEEVSPVAVGLAMRLLDVKGHNLKVNLFPEKASEIKSLRKDFLVTANVIAAAVLILILVTGGIGLMIKKANRNIVAKVSSGALRDAYMMLWEQEAINWRTKLLADRPSGLTKLIGLQQDVRWASFLGDIRGSTPKTVRITRLSGTVKGKVVLEGLALSYESIHLFVNALNKSRYVANASLAGTEKRDDAHGLVKYVINCSLVKEEEKGK